MKARDQERFMDYVEDQMEYMENQSRRNNVKILGLKKIKKRRHRGKKQRRL